MGEVQQGYSDCHRKLAIALTLGIRYLGETSAEVQSALDPLLEDPGPAISTQDANALGRLLIELERACVYVRGLTIELNNQLT